MNLSNQTFTEVLHTVTLHIYIYREEGYELPWSIYQRGPAYHYNAVMCVYIYIKKGDEPTWSINH